MSNVTNNLSNSCWFWSSVRIVKKYVEQLGVPKDLSNDILKKIVNNENVDIQKYDDETIKQSDATSQLDANAVEFLTVNGFYYRECVPVRNIGHRIVTLKLSDPPPFALLVQLPGHFMCVIQEGEDYILYDQIGSSISTAKLPYVKNENLLSLPICPLYTNIYCYVKGELPKEELTK